LPADYHFYYFYMHMVSARIAVIVRAQVVLVRSPEVARVGSVRF
jgi:hypothetical protein